MSERKVPVKFDERAVDAIFRDLDQCHLAGAAVGIAISGVPVYRKGFGLANMELPVMLNSQTRMRIASMTKQFTCLAYLLLCEEGKAAIDDHVGMYLPDLHPVTHRVTMRQLMSHTSGLRESSAIRWYFSGFERTVPASELVTLYSDIQDANFAPGEAWSYTNGGFQIISAVIEKLTQQPLEEVFRRRIFDPVGMRDTLLRRVDTDFVPNSAALHMCAPGGGYERFYMTGEISGEGGVVSTVDDILLWLKHMANPVVGKMETWELMRTPQKLRNGAATGFGLGLIQTTYRGVPMTWHGGAVLGGSSQMIRVPGANLDVVVLVNRHDVSALKLGLDVLKSCLGLESDPSEGAPHRVTGLFRSPRTGCTVKLYGKDGLQAVQIDGFDWPCLFVWSGNETLRPSADALQNFSLSWQRDSAQQDSILFEHYGSVDELQRVSSDRGATLETIVGSYLADTIDGARFRIIAQGTAGQLIAEGRFGSRAYRLEEIGNGIWRVRPIDPSGWGWILSLQSGGSTVALRSPGLWQVPFRRVS